MRLFAAVAVAKMRGSGERNTFCFGRPTSFSHAHCSRYPKVARITFALNGGCGKNERKEPKMRNGGDWNKGIGVAGCDETQFRSKMTK